MSLWQSVIDLSGTRKELRRRSRILYNVIGACIHATEDVNLQIESQKITYISNKYLIYSLNKSSLCVREYDNFLYVIIRTMFVSVCNPNKIGIFLDFKSCLYMECYTIPGAITK